MITYKETQKHKRLLSYSQIPQGKVKENKKMEIQTKEKNSFEPIRIEEGMYEGVLKEIKVIGTKTYTDGNECVTGIMVFETKIDDKVIELSHYIPDMTATAGNKFGKALTALGAVIEYGKPYDTDQLLGKKARLLVENFEKEIDDKKVELSGISKVKPLNKE